MRWFVAFLVVAALIVGGAWLFERYNWELPASGNAKGAVVLIAPGSGVGSIAQDLKKSDVIADTRMFEIGLRLRDLSGKLKAGEYEFPAHASMGQVAAIIVEGRSIKHKLTVAEGLTSQMIYDIVKNDPVLVGDAGPVPDEGTLLPETYLFTRGTTRAAIIAQMRKRPDQADRFALGVARSEPSLRHQGRGGRARLDRGKGNRCRARTAAHRGRVRQPAAHRHQAAIRSDHHLWYHPRLSARPAHQAERDRHDHGPSTPNVIPGLPSSPICNPGKDAIAAVLNPATTNDIFFVADGTGGHVFARTIEEQNRNVAAWRKIHNAQN
jgi:UPF0755 protein